ncbi:telomere repeats-binding bouquet formation protein 1 [Genypterus blacodes]|uniref:telomere repeats-binding bouquet formation protein 1 n=1 Tax=Genypterus blacodes TaxID=154954 RepID=UPI003F76EDDD
MDKSVSSNCRNTTKTDLSLLLECLKFQMKYPDHQKQALLTIHSICENREDNVDLLREMGGVLFIYNLSKSSIVHSDVKETALFTVCALAEANVYCKNSLCRKEIYSDLAGWLTKEDVPLTHKRVSVYLVSVLVANNKLGQTLAQSSGCLDILLVLFRTTFPLSSEGTRIAANATQIYQLWASVSSAICGCVNNPQNEEGQRICVAVFPIIKSWLQRIVLPSPEMFQPICSFIAITVANNSCVQESFFASGVFENLTLALVHLASAAEKSLLSCQLSVTIAKTLSACITDNSALASCLVQYAVVPQLVCLLTSPNLDPDDRLSVLLTLGHCTVASEEHQSQLVQCGGLPLIITLLTEDTSDEVRKAATFILQTCKQATTVLGVPGQTVTQREIGTMEPLTNMESHRSSAREMLHRIELLEKRQAQEAEDEWEKTCRQALAEELGHSALAPALLQSKVSVHSQVKRRLFKASDETQICEAASRAHERTESKHSPQEDNITNNMSACGNILSPEDVEVEGDGCIKLQSVGGNMIKNESFNEVKNARFNVSCQREKAEAQSSQTEPPQAPEQEIVSASIAGKVQCTVCKGTGALKSSHVASLEGVRERHTADRFPHQMFKHPKPATDNVAKESKDSDLCDSVITQMTPSMSKHTRIHNRCSGCLLTFEEVTSWTFASLQNSCHHSCDMHRILQEATERFRARFRDSPLRGERRDIDPDTANVSATKPQRSSNHWADVSLTPISQQAGRAKSCQPDKHQWKGHNGISATPLNKGETMERIAFDNWMGVSLTPRKNPCHSEWRRRDKNGGCAAGDQLKTSRLLPCKAEDVGHL